MITLRPMRVPDLELVAAWLEEPHLARWYLDGSSLDHEIEDLRASVTGGQPTHAFVVEADKTPVGWCQWYLCCDYPEYASGVGASASDVGIDYAIGDAKRVGVGLGTALIGVLVEQIRTQHREAGVVADPDAENLASRRVLEKNGFLLLAERSVFSEPKEAPVAIYRLAPSRSDG